MKNWSLEQEQFLGSLGLKIIFNQPTHYRLDWNRPYFSNSNKQYLNEINRLLINTNIGKAFLLWD